MATPTDFLLNHIPHIVAVVLLPFVIWGLKMIAVSFWETLKGTVNTEREKLARCDANLDKMMTNHLPHMQISLDTMVGADAAGAAATAQ